MIYNSISCSSSFTKIIIGYKVKKNFNEKEFFFFLKQILPIKSPLHFTPLFSLEIIEQSDLVAMVHQNKLQHNLFYFERDPTIGMTDYSDSISS